MPKTQHCEPPHLGTASPPLIQPRPAFLIAAILMAAASRFVPHPPNFTPIGAVALFGGASFASRRAASLVPLGAMFASDLILGVHVLLPVVYACLAFNVFLGRWLCKRRRPLSVAAGAFAGSCVFFIVTNAACWAQWYPRTFAGLTACYVAAIPFLRNTLLGDGFYAVVLFASLALAEWMVPAIRDQSRGAVSLAN